MSAHLARVIVIQTLRAPIMTGHLRVHVMRATQATVRPVPTTMSVHLALVIVQPTRTVPIRMGLLLAHVRTVSAAMGKSVGTLTNATLHVTITATPMPFVSIMKGLTLVHVLTASKELDSLAMMSTNVKKRAIKQPIVRRSRTVSTMSVRLPVLTNQELLMG